MNTYNINDQEFVNSTLYKEFIKQNPTNGFLSIRAFAANQAIPISGLKIVISKIMDGNNIIFFEGTTNTSGIIENIKLPTPKQHEDNLTEPASTTYDVVATYNIDNIKQQFQIKMYENIGVIQNINIIPKMNLRKGDV